MRHEQTSPKLQSPIQSASNGSSNGALSPNASAKALGTSNSNGHTANGHSKTEGTSVGTAYSNGASNPIADGELWQGHSKKEVTRILIQSLADLGFPNAAKQLSTESGLELERPHVASFRQAVLRGDWAEAESILFGGSPDEGGGGDGGGGSAAHQDAIAGYEGRGKAVSWGAWTPQRQGLPLAEGANKSQMQFWMRQQKYLELLEKRDLGGALTTLRSELTPLNFDMARLHQLSR